MISTDLLQKTILYFNKFKNLDIVINPSIPILYFGDLRKYRESKLQVITVGKNPSDNEFRLNKKDAYSFVRFPNWNDKNQNLIDVLNEYFISTPLNSWFSCYEPILNGMSTSYYPQKNVNVALHTDICSPLATSPTWSKLSKENQELLFKEGILIWKELIEELQPDVMFVSIPRNLFASVFTDKKKQLISFNEKKDGSPRKIIYKVEETEYLLKNGKKVNVIFGQAANKPFDTISEKQKINIGKQCLK